MKLFRDQHYETHGAQDDILVRFEKSWFERATVRRPFNWEAPLQLDKPDFLENLLPFRDDAAYVRSPDLLKQECLSAGWIIYNYKTISIETDIICPACIDVLRMNTSSKLSFSEAAGLAETLTDEGFHALVSIGLCKMTSQQRGLDICVPEFELIATLHSHKQQLSEREYSLVRLAYATVSEVFISDYLNLLSSSTTIQPLFQAAVALHKVDEMAHRRLFPLLARRVIKDCSNQERQLFVNSMFEAMAAFSSRESRVWNAVLGQLYADAVKDGYSVPQCVEEEGGTDFSAIPAVLDNLGLAGASADERLLARLQKQVLETA